MIPRLSSRVTRGIVTALILLVPILSACSALGRGPNNVGPTATASAPSTDAASTPGSTTAPSPTGPSTAQPGPTSSSATVTVVPTPAAATPSPAANALEDTVTRYTTAWQNRAYSDMYGLVSTSARSTITEEKFVARYSSIADGIGLTSTTVQASIPPNAAAAGASPQVTVPIHVVYKLSVLGDVAEDNVLPLVLENGVWRVAWTPSLIFRDLTADRLVRYDPVLPRRGSIFDRNGNVLAQEGPIQTIGVVPGEIKDQSTVVSALADYLKMSPDDIKKAYSTAQPDWFVPLKDLSAADGTTAQAKLSSIPGIAFRDNHRRVYPYGPATAHVVGYETRVQASELKTLHDKGYEDGDWIGRAGLEAWGEDYLRGQKGATLAIVDSDGAVVRTIAQKLSVAGNNIYTTLDVNYQTQANKVLGSKTGSIIVMNPQDNSLLAIASLPSYDPNQFILGMTDAQYQTLNGPQKPLLFRATQGLYPTGSIFKVITLSAGLERGGFKPSDTFDCGMDWKGLPGVTLHNWKAEGTLNLIQGLTGSCDPTFYTIGLKLNQIDPTILPSFARAFGLGQSTGAAGLDDAPGTVPDPAWKEKQLSQPWYDGDGVNLAIGQGFLLANPLQMANVFSTIANNGKIQTPVLVSQIKRPDGTVVKSFATETKGAVPVSHANLGYVQQGMREVTSTPLGTAYYAWQGSPIPMEAKTGSAENETTKAHAWFVGYTSPEHPTLLTLVMLEGGELGGQFAAPLGRQIVEYAIAHPVKPPS